MSSYAKKAKFFRRKAQAKKDAAALAAANAPKHDSVGVRQTIDSRGARVNSIPTPIRQRDIAY